MSAPVDPAATGGAPSGRARLQRVLRVQRRHATRDAVVGALLCLAVVVGVSPPTGATNPTAPDDADAVFTAAMVGDLMFARHVEEVAAVRGYDALLEPARPYLAADYVTGNLEQVVSERDDLPEARKLIHLRGGPEPLGALVDAGFTAVTLANNHTMDHGIPGLSDTLAALEAADLAHVGAGLDLDEASEVLYQDLGGLRVATLSFTDAYVEGFVARAFQGGVMGSDETFIVPAIQRARSEADLVVVQFHWGVEYDFSPDRRQRELAELSAAAGADLIVGHHPHTLQPVERLGDAVVFYSLGNFVFDQGWSRTRETAVARYHLRPDGVAEISLHPFFIREATPRPLTGATAWYRRLRIHLQLRGEGLDWWRDADRLVAEVDHRHVVERRASRERAADDD